MGKEGSKNQSELQRLTDENGQFDMVLLHEAPQNKLLTDLEMTNLMPLSYGNMEVLGAIHLGSAHSNAPILEGLSAALKNADIQHVMLPVGPGHWRGVYISKPTSSDPNHKIEVFDSMGTDSAKSLGEFVKTLLQANAIKNYKITYSAPKIKQKDGYSCGDFVCAYSHKKMRALNAQSPTCWPEMITAFNEANGNHDGCLRDVTRVMSSEPTRGLSRSASPASIDHSQVVETGLKADPKPQKMSEVTVKAEMAVVPKFEGVAAQKIWQSNAHHYGDKGQAVLAALIQSRETLFAKRHSDAQADMSEDEKFAIELQCQEFENAGFKP